MNQHISNRTDIRISIKLRIAAFLLRQIPRLRQIVHDLMNISWNRLRNLETKPNANTEHVIRAEILNRILASERLIGGLDGNRPPSAGTFWMVGENREEDVGIDNTGKHGELTKWAENGVLLLNNVLTVREGCANSHKGMGWEEFTDDVIKLLNEREKPMVFLLWGANARAKTKIITNPNHLILTCAHPSPLSAYNGFFGCRHFSKANAFLKSHGIEVIDWSID